MRMKPHVLLLVSCMLLTPGLQLNAQSGHVYEDSSILYPKEEQAAADESITTAPATEEPYNSESSEEYPDTALVNNRLFLSPDSIEYFRRDKQFAYARNLDSLLDSLRKKREEDDAKKASKRNKKNNSGKDDKGIDFSKSPSILEKFFNSTGLQVGLWSLAGLFVLFVMYKLFFGTGSFKRAPVKSSVTISEETAAEDPIPEREFDGVIKKAVAENNYRLAVRYLHLQLLRRLADAGAITLARDKTNAEYLREITGKPYKEEVKELTRYYDYVWYGEFTPASDAFQRIQSRFKNVVI